MERNLEVLISEINDQLKPNKLSKISAYDERALLGTVATIFRNAQVEGRIRFTPAFYLDSDESGSMIVRLLPNEEA